MPLCIPSLVPVSYTHLGSDKIAAGKVMEQAICIIRSGGAEISVDDWVNKGELFDRIPIPYVQMCIRDRLYHVVKERALFLISVMKSLVLDR